MSYGGPYMGVGGVGTGSSCPQQTKTSSCKENRSLINKKKNEKNPQMHTLSFYFIFFQLRFACLSFLMKASARI
jgi:hypothetical protein